MTKSPWLAAAASLFALWCVLFAPQVLRGQIFTLGDTIAFRPFPDYSRARWLESHQRTFWNPFILGGLPATVSLADSRPQYLPDVALDLIERLRAPISRALPMAPPLLAHLAGMLAVAGLARALWRAGPLGMVWAGAAWGLMPDLVVPLAYGHDAQCLSASLMPVSLLAVHHAIAADGWRVRLAATLALALAVALTTLGGHPQIVVYGATLVAGFLVERVISLRRAGRIPWVALGVALGVAMGAAAWYPALLYSAHSARGAVEVGAALAEVARYSLGFGDLASLAWPAAVGHSGASYWGGLPSTEYPRYVGIAVLAAALASWVGRRPGGSAAAYFAAATCAGLLVSLGTNVGSIYRLLHEWVPFWSRFRVPAAVQIVPQLGLALLSARYFAGAERGEAAAATPARGSMGPRALRVAAGALLALAGLAGLALWSSPLAGVWAAAATSARPAMPAAIALEAAHRAGLDLLLRVAVLAAALGLFRLSLPREGSGARDRWRALAACALPLLLAADLGSLLRPILARSSGPADVLYATPAPELARIAAADPHLRVVSGRPPVVNAAGRAGLEPQAESSANDWVRWRARTLGGGHSAAPAVWQAGGEVVRSYPALCALGVGYVSLAPGSGFDPARFEKVKETGDEMVLRVRAAVGRLYAVPRVVAPGNDVANVAFMNSPGFDPRQVACAAEADAAGDYPGSSGCQLRWVEDGPDFISFEVDATDRAFVVLADTFFPGWSAQVDGEPAPLRRVNQAVRGVAIPAGRHRVTMRYVPEGWAATVPVTRIAMLAWLAGTALLALRAPRRKMAAAD